MKKADNKNTHQNQHSTEDVIDAIEKLKGSDRVGSASQALTTAGGAAAGVSAAGAVAAAAGASTLFGSTTLAGTLGGFLVASTPVGWVVGCAVAGAAAAYGVSRLVRSGGRNDRVREEIVERLSKRLAQMRARNTQPTTMTELRQAMTEAIQGSYISNEQAARMVDLVEEGKLGVEIALARIRSLCSVE